MRIALLLPLVVFGCVTDSEPSEELTFDEDTSAQASTLCISSPNAPADDVWYVGAAMPRVGTLENYGTGACDAYLLEARKLESLYATPLDIPTTPDACTGTAITIRRYTLVDGRWAYTSGETQRGVWTFEGCSVPEVRYDAHTTGSVRAHLSVSRTTCSGELCGITRGLPIHAGAAPYVTVLAF